MASQISTCVTIALSLLAISARLPKPPTPLAAPNLRIHWIVILFSIVSMSGGVVLTIGTINSSVAGLASISMTGATSGMTAGSGAIGTIGSGSIVSAGVGMAGSRKAIASVPNCASTAALNVGFRVNDPIYRWIENQATGGESPHQVVQRLVRELAGSDGVTIGLKAKSVALVDLETVNDRIDEQNNRIAILEAAIATFADSLKQS